MVEPKIEGITLVFLGNLNPAIFHPAWFGAEELILKESAETAKVEVVSPTITRWSTDWLELQVLADRMQLSCSVPPKYDVLFDLAVSIFRLLRHTPVPRMGLNLTSHFALDSTAIWHDCGHNLAPKNVWKGVLDEPGLRQISMAGKRKDDLKGKLMITAEPSVRFNPGLFLRFNDEINIESKLAGEAAEILERRQPDFQRESRIALQQLLTNILPKEEKDNG